MLPPIIVPRNLLVAVRGISFSVKRKSVLLDTLNILVVTFFFFPFNPGKKKILIAHIAWPMCHTDLYTRRY
jgi:hypothetical protein